MNKYKRIKSIFSNISFLERKKFYIYILYTFHHFYYIFYIIYVKLVVIL